MAPANGQFAGAIDSNGSPVSCVLISGRHCPSTFSNFSGGGQANITYTTESTDNSLAFSWQWRAAVYNYWSGNNQAEIQPYHGNGYHAGTPLNQQVQQSLIQGPRGGCGSNYTGSWSATGNGACPGAQ